MLYLLVPLLFLALRASAAAFTVLDVDNGSLERPSIVAVSPLGVGQNGATTYDVAKEVHTGGFIANNGVTTFFGSPVTIHATVVANSEGSVVTEAPQVGQPFAQHVVCGFNRGVGACVSHLFDDGAQITVPFTGKVFPLFTVTVDDAPGRNAQPTPPPSPSSGTPREVGPASASSPTASPTAPPALPSPKESNGATPMLSRPRSTMRL
ncbi:hypothetical protein AB1N83_005041 [Pleurotus pulmonarius]